MMHFYISVLEFCTYPALENIITLLEICAWSKLKWKNDQQESTFAAHVIATSTFGFQ